MATDSSESIQGLGQARPRLVGLGMGIVDMLAPVDEAFLKTVPGDKGGTCVLTKEQQDDIVGRLPVPPRMCPGGAAANTLAGVARLMGDAVLLAPLGDDGYGSLLKRSLSAEGVDMSRCPVLQGGSTGVCLSLVTSDAERTMCTFRGVNDDVENMGFSASLLSGCTHFFIEGYQFARAAFAADAIRTAHKAGLVVCMDFNSPEVIRSHRPLLECLLRDHVTAVFANELEAAAFADTHDMETALSCLSSVCPVAVVKLGCHGSLIKVRGQGVLHIPAIEAKAIDTTGAGDLWAAGFFAAWLKGRSMEEAGVFGARVAAEVVQVPGAHLPDSVWEELRRHL